MVPPNCPARLYCPSKLDGPVKPDGTLYVRIIYYIVRTVNTHFEKSYIA